MLADDSQPGPAEAEQDVGSAHRAVRLTSERSSPEVPEAFENGSSSAEPSPPRPIPTRSLTHRLSVASTFYDDPAKQDSGRPKRRRRAVEEREGGETSGEEMPRDRHATFRAPSTESSQYRARRRAGSGDSSRPLVPRTEPRRHDSDLGRRRPSGRTIHSPRGRPPGVIPPPRASLSLGSPAPEPFVSGPRMHTTGGPPPFAGNMGPAGPGRFIPDHRHHAEGVPPVFAENTGAMGAGKFDRPHAEDVEQGLSQPESHHVPQPLLMSRVNWDDLSLAQKTEILRLQYSSRSAWRNHFVCGLGELVGTTLFLFFAFAATEVANIKSSSSGSDSTTGAATGFNISVLFYISTSFALSLLVNVWIFFRISGGLFNPAVTLGMYLIDAISLVRAFVLFIAQIMGGLLASVIVRFLFPESFNVRTTLGAGTNVAQGVFIEAILTAELVFTIFMLAYEKHRATFVAPVGIGLALFIAELVGVEFTGGSLNPSRSFGPCVVTATFDSEHWIYWVGPGLGSCIAVGFYKLIKLLEYELVNPGADSDHLGPTTTTERVEDKSQGPSSARPGSAPATVVSH